jgi:excisionase family DNA binding protein
MSPAPALLRVAEAAERLGCSRWHIYDLIAKGQLAAVDIGIGRAQTRVREDELTAYIEARTRRAAS